MYFCLFVFLLLLLRAHSSSHLVRTARTPSGVFPPSSLLCSSRAKRFLSLIYPLLSLFPPGRLSLQCLGSVCWKRRLGKRQLFPGFLLASSPKAFLNTSRLPQTHTGIPETALGPCVPPPGAASRRGALPGAGPVRAGGGRAGPGAAVRCGDPSWPRP